MSWKTALVMAMCGVLGACGAPEDGPDGSSAQAKQADGVEAEGAGGDHTFSCDGAMTSPSARLAPLCIGGEPGTRCGESSCAAFDAQIRYEPPAALCVATELFLWDGTTCKGFKTSNAEGAMHCRGADCGRLFKSLEACRTLAAECEAR